MRLSAVAGRSDTKDAADPVSSKKPWLGLSFRQEMMQSLGKS